MQNPISLDLSILEDLDAQVARDHALKNWRPTAVGIVRRYVGVLGGLGDMLFVKSAKKGNQWGFLQGGIHEGEGAVTGMLRELREEVGIGTVAVASCRFCRRTELLRSRYSSDGFRLGKSYYYFAVHCWGNPQITLKLDEVCDYRWVPANQADDFICKTRRQDHQKSADMRSALSQAFCV